MAQWLTNVTRNHEVVGSIPGLGSSVAMSCGIGCRQGLDPKLLWLWRRPATTALIRPLAWEPPYAMGAALEKAKRQKQARVCMQKLKNDFLNKKKKNYLKI